MSQIRITVEKEPGKIVLKRLSGDTFTSVDKQLNDELGDFLFTPDERIDPNFVDYMNAAKDEFVRFINKQDWNNELRTNAESFIIAYDQIAERLVKAVC